MDLAASVLPHLQCLKTDRPVIVAFSGGGDSLALLHLVHQHGLPVVAAHLDHGLRSESAEQVEMLRAWAERLNLEFLSERAPVAEWAARWGLGLEAAGRRLRYRWLRRLAKERQSVVLTAHTREDVVETVLMRLVAGTSLSGLGGPRRWRGSWLYRPLLTHTRAALREYLSERGVSWLEDPSNQDPRFLRSWVRHRLMPVLEERNPKVSQGLERLANSADDLRKWTWRSAANLRDLDPQQLARWPAEVRFQAISQAWRAARPAPGARFSRLHFDLCEKWMRDPVRKPLQLPGGVFMLISEGKVGFSTTIAAAQAAPPPFALDFAGPPPWHFSLDGWGLQLTVSWQAAAMAPQPWCADLKELPATVRGRRDGDRFGSAKLKKRLQEWEIPAAERDRVPLVCDRLDQPLWAVGYRVRPQSLAAPGQSGFRFHFSLQVTCGRESNLS